MEEQNESAGATPPPEPAFKETPRHVDADAASPYRPVVAAMLISALLIGGSLLGASVYLGEKIEGIRAQLGDIGGTPPSQRPRADGEEEAPQQKIDLSKVVTPSDPSRGPKNAKVTIVEFSDYECPFCGRYYEETLPTLLKEYGGKVRFIWKDFPLPMHSNAPKASEAAHCAGEQGKYWEFHDVLFQNQRALAVDDLRQYAAGLNLDTQDFNACLDSGKFANKVKEDTNLGRSLGVNGTPSFFVNEERVVGAQPVEEFKRRIDAILAK